jgi:ParB family chromosome partitioning protein
MHLKKMDMASEAEQLLDGSGWLPEALRTAGLTDGHQKQVAVIPSKPTNIAAEWTGAS